MLTKMTEEDWVLVLEVFDACRSRRGDKGRDDRSCYSGQVYRGRASGFQGAEPTGLPPHSTHWCRHGLVEPEPPIEGRSRKALIIEKTGS